jgi:hypothetical protein
MRRHNPVKVHERYDAQPWQAALQDYEPLRGHQKYEDGPTVVIHQSNLHAGSDTRPCGTDGSSNRLRVLRQQTKILHSNWHCRKGSIPSRQRCRWLVQPCRTHNPRHNLWVPWHSLLRRQYPSTGSNAKVCLLDPYGEILVLTGDHSVPGNAQ